MTDTTGTGYVGRHARVDVESGFAPVTSGATPTQSTDEMITRFRHIPATDTQARAATSVRRVHARADDTGRGYDRFATVVAPYKGHLVVLGQS